MERLIFPLSQKEAADLGTPCSSAMNKEAVFPSRLRELRDAKGQAEGRKISQKEIADAIGVTKATVSLYEQGDNVPDVKTLVKIAKYYGVAYEYLLGESDCKQRDNIDIGKKTGLSDGALNRLDLEVLMKRPVPSFEGEVVDVCQTSLDTINAILEARGKDDVISCIDDFLFRDFVGDITFTDKKGCLLHKSTANSIAVPITGKNAVTEVKIDTEEMMEVYLSNKLMASLKKIKDSIQKDASSNDNDSEAR